MYGGNMHFQTNIFFNLLLHININYIHNPCKVCHLDTTDIILNVVKMKLYKI